MEAENNLNGANREHAEVKDPHRHKCKIEVTKLIEGNLFFTFHPYLLLRIR